MNKELENLLSFLFYLSSSAMMMSVMINTSFATVVQGSNLASFEECNRNCCGMQVHKTKHSCGEGYTVH